MRVVCLALLVFGCTEGAPVPFEVTGDARSVIADWQASGLSCEEPEVGMPGPAVDWVCRQEIDGVAVTARLIADSIGVQSIHLGVPSGTLGADAASAFSALVRVTSLLRADQQRIEDWLRSTNAADGLMPSQTETAIARASVARDAEGDPILYIVPLGSSMLLAE